MKSHAPSVKFQVQVDDASFGKLKYNSVVSTRVAPGEYSLDTTLGGQDPLLVKVQPGQTIYVHSKMRKLGERVLPELVLVEEKVAMDQQPAIESNI